MGADLLHIAVVLQEGAAHVQGQVRAVDHAVEQHEELGDNLLDVIRHKHLAGEQLDLSLMGAEIVLELGEVQDALQVEGIVHVQVDPEQRILIAEQLVVEALVFLVGAVGGLLEPQGGGFVDQLGLGHFLHGFHLLGAVLVLLALHRHLPVVGLSVHVLQINGRIHESAVAGEYLADAVHLEEFLFFLADVKDHRGAVYGAAALADFKVHAVRGGPVYRLSPLLVGQGFDFHMVRHHEHRVEAQAEVADDIALLLVLLVEVLHELGSGGESHLVDVAAHLVSGHADAGVADGDGLVVLVHGHGDAHGFLRAGVEHPVFGNGVAAVADHLAQENILVGIQPALDDGHDILRVNGYGALFHFNGHDDNLLR